MTRQDSSGAANKHKLPSPGKVKHKAESKTRGNAGVKSFGIGDIVRLSPYVRRSAKCGSKTITCGIPPKSFTQNVPSGANLTVPKTVAPRRGATCKIATTFVSSVISLCSKSIESCSDMSEPLPCEDMFLHLVSLCGIAEAKYWSEMMGF